MDILTFLNYLDKVKKTGADKWQACCPGHDDKSPSMAIKAGDYNRILLHCFAGCSTEEITGALGLKLTDLFPDKGIIRTRRKFSIRDVEKALLHELYVLQIAIHMRHDREPIHPDNAGREALAVKRILKLFKDLYRAKTK